MAKIIIPNEGKGKIHVCQTRILMNAKKIVRPSDEDVARFCSPKGISAEKTLELFKKGKKV